MAKISVIEGWPYSRLIYIGGGMLIVLAMLGFLVASPVSVKQPTSQLKVIATFFPLYDFARIIGGDEIQLEMLFTQTPEVSSFSPADILKLQQADIVIKNGAGLEPVLDELIAVSDNQQVTVIDTSQGIPVLRFTTSSGPTGIVAEEQGAVDPHIWLNPQHALRQVAIIRDAFIRMDPAHADVYTRNAEQYSNELRALDQELETAIAVLPRKDFIAFHSAFQYFAARYGLHQVAVIEEFPGAEPSPQYIADIITIIRKTGVRTIFSEPQFSPRLVEILAHDYDLIVDALDPIETGDPAEDSYLSIMRENLTRISRALQ